MPNFHKFDTEIQIEESMIQERDIYEAGSLEEVEQRLIDEYNEFLADNLQDMEDGRKDDFPF